LLVQAKKKIGNLPFLRYVIDPDGGMFSLWLAHSLAQQQTGFLARACYWRPPRAAPKQRAARQVQEAAGKTERGFFIVII